MKTQFYKHFLFISFLIISNFLNAQDFMMQGWYWDFPKTCDGNNWANTLQGHATDLGNAGFTFMWLPPASRASSGNCSNGYDPQDIYDLGEFGQGATHFGTKNDLTNLISALNTAGIEAVADVVYNHRDGGEYEDNPAVRDYIMNYPNNSNCGGSVTPYPVNGKVRYYLEIGGSTGYGAGDYFFKFESASGNSGFNGASYKMYAQTSVVGFQNIAAISEVEPNGGGECGQTNQELPLGIDLLGTEDVDPGGFCRIDEYMISLDASEFNAAADAIEIYISEDGGSGSGIDITTDEVYYNSANIIADVKIQTRTDFSGMPSGQGSMNYQNFKPSVTPNSGVYATCLTGDYDTPLFFFDTEVDQPNTRTVYKDWTRWLLSNAIGFGGLRMDAVKHFNYELVSEILNDIHANSPNIPTMIVGESYDFDANTLKTWVENVENGMSAGAKNEMDVRVFDFALQSALATACDGFLSSTCGSDDARSIFTSGIVNGVNGNPFNVVTFINNHDFRGGDTPLPVQAPLLGYAYLLTNNQIGLPSIFYSDYYNVTPASHAPNFLQSDIDQLIELHQDYIFESPWIDYLNSCANSDVYNATYNSGFAHTSLIYQIAGNPTMGKDIIVAINFASSDDLDVDIPINTTNVGSGSGFNDHFSFSNGPSQIIVNGSNQVNLKVPARGFAVWVEGTMLPVEMVETSNNDIEFSLFPNPTKENSELLIQSKTQEKINIYIRDIEGKIIFSQTKFLTIGKNQTLIPTNKFIEGVYFIEIKKKNGELQTEKIIKTF